MDGLRGTREVKDGVDLLELNVLRHGRVVFFLLFESV